MAKKRARVNCVAPEVRALKEEFALVDGWFERVQDYKA
jgi:hypothetical protein